MTRPGRTRARAIELAPNLRSGLADMLMRQIEAGDLLAGDRLPTEQAIVTSTGVSRTVVREALASLRARGLIVTQQGSGAFVAGRQAQRHFTIDPEAGSLADTLAVLELRLGLETEAVGLAAERRTGADLATIRERLERVTEAKGEAGIGAEEDFAFHRAILNATGNPFFGRVFDVFGSVLIPRQLHRLGQMAPTELAAYLRRLRREHEAIVEAIARRDPVSGRRAMRRHLARSLAIYRALAAVDA